MIDIAGSLLERPVIKKEFDLKYKQLVKLLDKEMDIAKEIYDHHVEEKKITGRPRVHKNMPVVTGELKWCSELRHRISEPMMLLRHVDHP